MGDVSGILFVIVSIGFYVWSLIWVASDAEARGKSALPVVLLVALLSWPLGLIAWLIFRPKAPSPDFRGATDEHELVRKAQEKLKERRKQLSDQNRGEL